MSYLFINGIKEIPLCSLLNMHSNTFSLHKTVIYLINPFHSNYLTGGMLNPNLILGMVSDWFNHSNPPFYYQRLIQGPCHKLISKSELFLVQA